MKIEPNANLRQFAALTYETYHAFLDAGFTENEALNLVMHLIEIAHGEE